MRWSKYIITTSNGFECEFIMGQWLKAGEYSFGKVRLVGELSDEESREFLLAERELYEIWYEQFSLDIEEAD